MPVVKRAEEAFEEDVKAFPGLLAALLYSDLDSKFGEFVRIHWKSLHDLTGQEMLILVPEFIQSQVIIRSERPYLLRPFKSVERIGRNILARMLSDHFGISLRHFPCIVFFEHPSSREAYCFSFRSENDVEGLARAMKEVVALAREVARESDMRAASEEELRRMRADMIQRLVPVLRRTKIFGAFKRLMTSRSMANVARIGGAALG